MDHRNEEIRIRACCHAKDCKQLDAYLNLASLELMKTEQGNFFLLRNQNRLPLAGLYHQGLKSACAARSVQDCRAQDRHSPRGHRP
jgi:hypothetical protein